jgi:hypothetical protein
VQSKFSIKYMRIKAIVTSMAAFWSMASLQSTE